MKTWYLKHPLSLYKETKEEIKNIAKINDFIIIDSKYGSNEEEIPKLTLLNEVKATKKTVKKVKEVKAED